MEVKDEPQTSSLEDRHVVIPPTKGKNHGGEWGDHLWMNYPPAGHYPSRCLWTNNL